MTLKALKEKLAAETAKVEALQTKAFGDSATADDLKALNDHLDALDAIEDQVKAAERAEARLAAQSRPRA